MEFSFGVSCKQKIYASEVNIPEIIEHPQSVRTLYGSKIEFSVTASGENLTYNWQYKPSIENGTWTNAGSTTNKISITATTQNEYLYRCLVSNDVYSGDSAIQSDVACLYISNSQVYRVQYITTIPTAPVITKQPLSAQAPMGDKITFTIEVTGDNLSYQWQYKPSVTNGTWTNAGSSQGTGYNTNTFTTIALTMDHSGYEYRCIVRDDDGYYYGDQNAVISDTATIQVTKEGYTKVRYINESYNITDHPVTQLAFPGESVTFKVSASGNTTLTYRWLYKTTDENSSWTEVPTSMATGTQTDTLVISNVLEDYDNYMFRCSVGGSFYVYEKSLLSNIAYLLTIEPSQIISVMVDTTNLITSWEVAANQTIKLPISGDETNLFKVDWGDGTVEEFTTESFPSHTYTDAGNYDVIVSGIVKEFGYYGTEKPDETSDYYTYVNNFVELRQWGAIGVERYGFAHTKVENVATFIHENTFANVTDMSNMFYNTQELEYLNLTNFDTTNITNVDNMFNGASNLQFIILGENFDNLTGNNMFANTTAPIIMQKSLTNSSGAATILDEESIGLGEDSNIYVNNSTSEILYEEAWAGKVNAENIKPILELDGDTEIKTFIDIGVDHSEVTVAGCASDSSVVTNLKNEGYTTSVNPEVTDTAGDYEIVYAISYTTVDGTEELMSITRNVTLVDAPTDDWLALASYYDLTWKDEYLGTSDDPYLIKDAADLAGLSKWVADGETFEGKYFKVTNNIDMSAHIWVPIGGRDISTKDGNYYYSSTSHYFAGNFDGGNYTISGIYYGAYGYMGEYAKYVALFGNVIANNSDVEIKNISLNSSCISGRNIVSGIIAQANESTDNKRVILRNIVVDIDISAWEATGLINGKSYNVDIYDSVYKGDIYGSEAVAGIAYDICNSKIINTHNEGNIEGYYYARGIANNVELSTIENSYNTGYIEANDANGILGNAYNSTIKNVYNKGNICTFNAEGSDINRANGIATSIELGSVENTYNLGNIEGETATGIVENVYTSTINGVYNEGSVSGERAAGIANNIESSIMENSYNLGYIQGYEIAGVVRSAEDSIIRDVYNAGTIYACDYTNISIKDFFEKQYFTAGIVEYLNNSDLCDSYNLGAVSGVYVAGVVNRADNSNIYDLYNEGTLYGEYVGGVANYLENGIIYNSYNIGEAKGYNLGGIVNWIYNSNLYNSYNNGKLSGEYVAGVVNYVQESNIYNSYNAGELDGDYIGIVANTVSDDTVSSIIQNVYYLDNANDAIYEISEGTPITSNITSFIPSGDGFELTTNESYKGTTNLLNELNYYAVDNSELDLSAWNISGDVNNGYPYHDDTLVTLYTPTDFTASSGDSADSITLTWNENGNNEYVKYELQVINASGDWVTISGDATSPFIHEGLKENTAYEYNIRAYNGFVGYSDYVYAEGFTKQLAADIDFIKDTIKPVFTNINAGVSGESIIVSFESFDENYNSGDTTLSQDTIIIKVGNTIIENAVVEMTKSDVASGEVFNFTLSNVTGNGTLSLIVPVASITDKAGNANVETEIPTELILDENRPDNVNNFRASGDSDLNMIITFENPDPSNKVILEELDENGDWVILSEDATSPFTRPGVEPNTVYEYRVHTVDASGRESTYSYTTGYSTENEMDIVIRNDNIKPTLSYVEIDTEEEYINKDAIITVTIEAKDLNYYYDESDITSGDVIIKVDGIVNTDAISSVSKTNSASGEIYQITVTNITGIGELELVITESNITDKAGNKNEETAFELAPYIANGTITDTAPAVDVNENVLTITCNQESLFEIVKIEYQYREVGATEFITVTNNIVENLAADTSYEVSTVVTDIAGTVKESLITTVKTDAMDISKITISADVEEFTSGDVNVTINYGGSVYTKEYSLNGTTWTTINDNEVTLTITQNTTIYARYSDSKTSTQAVTYEVDNIDKEKPVIGNAEVTPTGIANSKDIVASNIEDKGVSGVKAYYVSQIADLTAPSWTVFTGTEFTHTVTENGTYYVWVVDNAGNISEAKIVIVNNIVKPVTNVVIPDSIEIQVGEQITIPITYSGEAKEITYTSSDESIVSVEENIRQITGESTGSTTVKVIITNYDGTTVEKDVNVTVKARNIEITITSDGKDYSGDWTNKDVIVTLTVTGVTPAEYKEKVGADGTWGEIANLTTNEITGVSKITYNTDFSGDVYYVGKNAEGNNVTNETSGDLIRIDKTLPTMGTAEKLVHTNSIEVTIINATDDLSGIKEYEIGIYKDDELLATYKGVSGETTFSGLSSSTTYGIKYKVTDNAGNTTDLIDGGTSTTGEIIRTVTYDYLTNGGEGATILSEERRAGTMIDLTVAALKTGYTFKGWAITPTGEVLESMIMPEEDVTLYAIFKDEAAPNVSKSDYETVEGQLDIIIDVDDDGSGVKDFAVTTDEGNPDEWFPVKKDDEGNVIIAVPGTNKYYVWIRDVDGNFVMYEQVAIKDIYAPTGIVEISGDNIVDDLPYSQTQNVELKITAEDNESLPNEIRVAIYNEEDYINIKDYNSINWNYTYKDGGITVDWTTTAGDGLKRIYVIFRDKAGNVSMTIKEVE